MYSRGNFPETFLGDSTTKFFVFCCLFIRGLSRCMSKKSNNNFDWFIILKNYNGELNLNVSTENDCFFYFDIIDKHVI